MELKIKSQYLNFIAVEDDSIKKTSNLEEVNCFELLKPKTEKYDKKRI